VLANGRIAGLVSILDILRYIVEHLSPANASEALTNSGGNRRER